MPARCDAWANINNMDTLMETIPAYRFQHGDNEKERAMWGTG